MAEPTGATTDVATHEVVPLDPARDQATAKQLLALQRASYRVEADLIGHDGIPPLREELPELRAAGLHWLGAVDGTGRLLGAVGWTESSDELDLHRLVVDPTEFRRGVGRSLVTAVLARADGRRAVVATGRENVPARRLYESLGFRHRIDVEVQPGLWVSELQRPGN